MAGPIVTCPACTKKFKGKEGITGKKIKCPFCSTPFVVTAEVAQVKAGSKDGAKKAPTMTKAQQRVSWNKEDDDHRPYQLGEFDESPRCPNCANPLESASKIICLTCGYNTQTREWGATVRTESVTFGQHLAHLLPGLFFLIMLITFTIGILLFCLELPRLVQGTWASFFDHESTRMWIIFLLMGFMWAFGTLAFRRLVLNPKPKERVKEDVKD